MRRFSDTPGVNRIQPRIDREERSVYFSDDFLFEGAPRLRAAVGAEGDRQDPASPLQRDAVEEDPSEIGSSAAAPIGSKRRRPISAGRTQERLGAWESPSKRADASLLTVSPHSEWIDS